MTKPPRTNVNALVRAAKEAGRMKAEAGFADAMLCAYKLLRVYGLVTGKDNSRTPQAVLMAPAEKLWEALHKISPDLEIPAFLNRHQKRMATHSIMPSIIAEKTP